MTIDANTRRSPNYAGNDSNTSFAFSFRSFESDGSDIAATIFDTTSETELVKDVDFSVTLNADQQANPGGTITYPLSGSPLATGETLFIKGATDTEQPVDLITGGRWLPEVVESGLDRAMGVLQQGLRDFGRALRQPDSDATLIGPLPIASLRKGKLLGFDGFGGIAMTSPTAAGLLSNISDLFTGNGSTTQFTLTRDPVSITNLRVFVEGVRQTPTDDYTYSGTTLTFTTAPPLGAQIVVDYGALEATNYEVTGATDIAAVSSVALLKALTSQTDGATASTLGYYTSGDGGAGRYWFDASSSETADDGTIIQPTTGTGRWKLLHDGVVSVRQFGAKGDGVNDDGPAINAAIAASGVDKVVLPIPATYWKSAETITLGSNKQLTFLGRNFRSATGPNYIKATSAVTTSLLKVPAISKGVKIENARLDITDCPNNTNAFHQDQSWGVNIDGMTISGLTAANKVGILLTGTATTGCFWNTFNDIFVDGGGTGIGLKYDGHASQRITSTVVRNSTIYNCNPAFSLNNTGSGILFINCGAEQNAGDAVYIENTATDFGSQIQWWGGEIGGNSGWGFNGAASGHVIVHGCTMFSNASGDINSASLGSASRMNGPQLLARQGTFTVRDDAITNTQALGGVDISGTLRYAAYRARINETFGGLQDGHHELLRRIGGTEYVVQENRYQWRLFHSKSTANTATTIFTVPIPSAGGARIKMTARGVQTAAGPFMASRETVVTNNFGTLAKTDAAALTVVTGGATATITFTISGQNLLCQFNHGSATSSGVNFTIEVDGDPTGITKG